VSGRTTRPHPLGLVALSTTAAVTTMAALTAWHGFVTQPWDHFGRLLVIAAVVVVTGTLARWSGIPRWATTLIQAVVATSAVSLQLTGALLPIGSAGAEIGTMLDLAFDSARTYRAPIGPDVPPLWPLLVVGGGLFLFVVDTVACTWRKVPAAGLALLAIYSVPSGLLDDGPGWRSFVAGAVAFLLLLHLDAREVLPRWGRPIGPAEATNDWSSPVREAARAGAGRIGLVAVLLAVLGSSLVPVLDVAAFDMGQGSGNGEIKIRKPVADMRRDLDREADIPLITVRTDDPAPSYLRIAALNRYTGNEWSSGDRDVASDDLADGALPWPAGLAEDVPRKQYDYEVTVAEKFDSTWLPTVFPAAAVKAGGDWRFDPAAMDFLAADDDLDTRGLRYAMTSLQPDYGTDGRFFHDAPPGAVDAQFTDLSSGVPDSVRALALSVTDAAADDYQRALLLQRWFRRDGGFTYSLERAPQGTGNETLAGFLSPDGRVGYCEQFASAMAVMARVLDIPARVAVGFLRPSEVADGVWEYSSHDLHAWPELYFEGAGWVRFEPTPARRAGTVPDYSRVPVGGDIDEPSSAPSTSAAPGGPSASPTPSTDTTRPTEAAKPARADAAGDGSGGSAALRIAVGVVLLVAVLALLMAAPRAVRAHLRRRRLSGDVESLWAELHATAVDLGVPWPAGRSPREIATAVAAHLADPGQAPVERPRSGPEAAPEAAEALDRLLLAVEQTRYARTGDRPATDAHAASAEDAAEVTRALEAGVTPRVRQRATWLPRSLWQR